MGRDGTETRARLLRAGERVFARSGVNGASLREINAEAGQRNNSALHYHFGSREGLLQAIAQQHQRAIDARRVEGFARHDVSGEGLGLPVVVAIWIGAMTAELDTDEGRDYLRILPELVHLLGRVAPLTSDGSAGVDMDLPGLQRVVGELRRLMPGMDAVAVTARVIDASHFVAASLAARARALDEGVTPTLDAEDYAAHLVAMVSGALAAEPLPRSNPSA